MLRKAKTTQFVKITHRNGVPVLGEVEQERRAKIARRKHHYKMTEDEYRSRIRAQEGRCPICRNEFEKDPVIDHNHACCADAPICGLCVRALLCGKCNSMLGMAMDKPETLRAAAAYLEKYGAS